MEESSDEGRHKVDEKYGRVRGGGGGGLGGDGEEE